MIIFWYLLLVPEIINVNAFMNNSISSASAQIAEAAAESSYDSSYSAGLFVDCSSCECPFGIFSIVLTQTVDSAAHLAPSNASSANVTYVTSTPAFIKPVTSTSIVPFEEYWCENWDSSPANTPDSFPNNGTLEGWFYNLDANDKEFCLSLEKANYSSWAAASPTPVVIGTFTDPPVWEPTLTPPCCDTFCNIEASAVQLYFWPTPAPVPNVTTISGANGFTLWVSNSPQRLRC